MLKVTAIGGEPAVGKSYIMKKIIEKQKIDKPFTFDMYKLIKGVSNDEELVLGVYGNEQDIFPGTDKLSMAVQPEVSQFLRLSSLNTLNHDFKHIMFEGDRLFKGSLFDDIKSMTDFRLIIIKCDNELKEQRHKQRKDEQNESWLASRKTAVNNIIGSHRHFIKYNNSEKDSDDIVNFILSGSREGIIEPSQTTLF